MIIFLRDDTEAVFLSLILKAVKERKCLEESIMAYAEKKRVLGVLDQIQAFASEKLDHPILSFAISEIDKLMKVKRQEAKTKWIKFLIP
ncbi:MAG: hypothetical protein A3G33_08490 [Omnitrophica bacterium RIFCSPLOWO2_12_FULL_44_17]|uniref:Uncharacterized protein n=1 Tax=Candidatus Danuiimicrobium aquiferis TaxID=1801832 RepID=A0A1G1KW96_9BACT|nr:MAG: hypothetical protein A3B72_03710 [Omnitrophica bacterium RIFCSPHIGHO2_02_FULL_45_28]OGW90307.1 MAG: hypothetical protein A3E74_01305 [Omnitrophica bacterium RIFCSPHIGHO2_12_FULL_44_12]OGW97203.1 MAG: hypothetical protein A3G33_08490 [Omnitrophica bacterium RIFCSPLOWO2_12_FULL_44_17]OGX02259.1 MAG: hypothetical protein A3J12_08280 [Omnitrophica bacterium RIFCSPLOWO2_02_FULL_44_11]